MNENHTILALDDYLEEKNNQENTLLVNDSEQSSTILVDNQVQSQTVVLAENENIANSSMSNAYIGGLLSGTLVNERYRIEHVIGVGGFSFVYKAYDTKLRVDVAIKELFPHGLVSRTCGENEVVIFSEKKLAQFKYLKDRYILEARSLAKIDSSSCIVDIFDCFICNNTAYIVMEFLDGYSLEKMIKNNGKITLEQTIEIMEQVLSGLNAIHNKGIVHRDIKPSNVFITKEGKVKIIDFGAARLSSKERDEVQIKYSKVFTPGYAPPEQYRSNSKQGAFTDIYAAGAMCYYMLSGIIPDASVDRLLNDELVPLHEKDSDIPKSISDTIVRAMELTPELRIQTAKVFIQALKGKLRIRSAAAEKRFKIVRRAGLVVAVFILLISSICGYSYYRENYAGNIDINNMITADVSLSIAIPIDNTISIDEQRIKWDELSMSFNNYLGQICPYKAEISFEYIDNKDYINELRRRKTSNDVPDIFMAVNGVETSGSLDWVTDLISDTDILFSEYIYSKNAVPIYFDPVVLYVNDKLIEQHGIIIEDYLVNENIDSIYIENIIPLVVSERVDFISENHIRSTSALEMFINEEALFYLGLASDNIQLDKSIAGYYSILSAATLLGEQPVQLTTWKIDYRNDNSFNTAQLFLSYMLSDEAQDILCIQHSTAFPVNKSELEKFYEFYPQLSFLGTDETKLAVKDNS